MTTIFADALAGVMVCDSRAVSDDGVWFPIRKVIRCRGELIGVAGDCKDGDEWLDWHRDGRKGKAPKPKNPDEFSALILRRSGLYSVTEGAHEMRVDRGFHGIGSGGSCAIAAYLAFKKAGLHPDARACVQVACEVDSYTGGRVIVHKLKG